VDLFHICEPRWKHTPQTISNFQFLISKQFLMKEFEKFKNFDIV
jgi:hypothetical protein